jgi:hypothetical protein
MNRKERIAQIWEESEKLNFALCNPHGITHREFAEIKVKLIDLQKEMVALLMAEKAGH